MWIAGTVTAAVILPAGCTAPSNPWTFTEPPTRVEATAATTTNRPDIPRTTIVVGDFDDPSKAPHYSTGVGRSISAAFSRALMNDGKYDVLIREDLSISVDRVVRNPEANRYDELARLSRDHPDVDFVITGKVTDFHHTGDLPGEVSRWGVFGRRNEAIAAVDVRIVDLKSRRVVGADHLKGTAPAGRTASRELYRDVALDSYLFWSTPLGRASKNAIQLAVRRIDAVVPMPTMVDGGEPSHREPHVYNAWGRRLEISGGTNHGLVRGRRYYLLHQTHDDGVWKPLHDRVTHQPLMVSILSVDADSSRGMLLGERPRDVQMRGVVLRPSLPPSPSATPDDAPGTAPVADESMPGADRAAAMQ